MATPKQPTPKKTRKRRKTEVPGSYLGFSIQLNRLVHLLFEDPNVAFVGLEVVGDYAALDDSQLVLLTGESKSVTGDGNPVANASDGLWNTLGNWVEAAVQGRFDVTHARLVLHVSQPRDGSIARMFSSASSNEQATLAYAHARKALWDEKRQKPRSDTPLGIRDGLARFFGADAAVAVYVIRAFSLEFSHGSPETGLLAAIGASPMLSPDMVQPYAEGILGWAKIKTDSLIAAGKPAIISNSEFRSQSYSLVAMLAQRNILVSLKRDVSDKERTEHRRNRRYVRQLEFIELDESEIVDAVTDFIRAEADRTYWAKSLVVLEPHFDTFKKELLDAWKYSRMLTDAQHGTATELERGRVLYAQCALREVKVGGIPVGATFCRGSLHRLADEPLIGWHPNYKTLLNKPRRSMNGKRAL